MAASVIFAEPRDENMKLGKRSREFGETQLAVVNRIFAIPSVESTKNEGTNTLFK